MKIGILSRNRSLYSTRRLAQAARLRGHETIIIDTVHLALDGLIGGHPNVGPPWTAVPAVNAIIPRIGASVTAQGLAVVRRFEAGGVITTATAEAIARSRDKLQSLQLMGRFQLSTPRTVLVTGPDELPAAIELVGGLPVVLKLLQATQGRGVILAYTIDFAESILRALQRLRARALVQEFISEAEGKDIRVIVIGDRCVAAMERSAAPGEFRANLHLGGIGQSIELDEPTRRLAMQAARAHELGVAGVDIVQSRRGPLLLEVNSSPGLEGIERVTRQDVATPIVRYLERAMAQKTRRRRGPKLVRPA